MKFSIRKLTKRLLIFANVLVALGLVAASLQPQAGAEGFWFLGFFSLAFPYLLIILIVFIFFWLAASIPYTIISILAMAIAWKQIDVVFNVKQFGFNSSKDPNAIRVMSWNVMSFRGMEANRRAQDRNADKILDLIEETNPDILCIQEFGQYDNPTNNSNYVKLLLDQGFKSYFLSKDYVRKKVGYTNGVAIFSKLPLIEVKKVSYKKSPESFLYADLLYKEDTIRIFTTHLESFKFSGTDYRDIEKIKNTEDSLYEASLNIYSKMRRAYKHRASQADALSDMVDESPYPAIVACDMNDVPTSYSYWKLKANRQDAFAEKGFGVGSTFLAIAPTLRIDFIFASREFDTKQFNIVQRRYSDHLPIVADLALQHASGQ